MSALYPRAVAPRLLLVLIVLLFGFSGAVAQRPSSVSNTRGVLGQMMGGSYTMRGRNIEPSVVFMRWELDNQVYSLTTVTRHRRVMVIGRFTGDESFEESSSVGTTSGRLIGGDQAIYEGDQDGSKITQRLQRVGEGRYRLIHEVNGRQYPIDIERISTEEGQRLAARLYPAEYDLRRASPQTAPVPAAPVSRPIRSALVVGVSNYSNLVDLPNPANDARAIGRRLTSLGYRVEVVIDPTRATLSAALGRFRTAIENAEGYPALFYYAGHAIEVRGRNFLLPADMPSRPDGSIEDTAVALENIAESMPVRRNATRVIILDACRNSPIRMSSVGRGLALFSAPEAMFVAYSTAPGMVAADGSGNHSPFTEALLQQLRQGGQPIEAVFRGVRRSVLTATSGQQIPWDSSSLLEPFTF